MIRAVFAVPGELGAPTGGYAYARRLLALLPQHGVELRHLALPPSFPHPTRSDLAEAARLLSAPPEGDVLLIDGLAYGAMPPELIREMSRPVVALVHHPLGLEAGFDPVRREALLLSERRALALARGIVVTSPFTRRLRAGDFGVAEERITVAEPGTEPAARGRGTGTPAALLAVGAVSARKGYEVLIEALAGMRDLDWRLTIAGSLDRAPEAAKSLRTAVRDAGLSDLVTLAGAVPDAALDALYAAADVFVSPSLFEGYGMALAEALVRGIPLVASRGGAGGDTVPDAAGLKVPSGDPDALRDGLRRMVGDPDLRWRSAEAAWAAGQRLPRWDSTAAKVAGALRAALG